MLTHPWFLLGTMAPLGCLIGYAIGTVIDPKPMQSYHIGWDFGSSPNETQINGACIGGAVGLLMLPVASVLTPAIPVAEHLLGKPSEYVLAYTTAYKRHTYSSRLRGLMGHSRRNCHIMLIGLEHVGRLIRRGICSEKPCL